MTDTPSDCESRSGIHFFEEGGRRFERSREKYVEVKQLIAIGKEKGFPPLRRDLRSPAPKRSRSLPEELDEI